MARPKDPEKRTAILDAAVHEIAATGIGAPTARIAKRAGIAEGTLFTYFSSKEELLNELYVALKTEFYTLVNTGFPHTANLERRAHHLWATYLNWAIAFPQRRQVSVQLNLAHFISEDARARASADRGPVYDTLAALDEQNSLRSLPHGAAAAMMSALQEAAMNLVAQTPEQRQTILEGMFQLFWRAVR
jgi:AcrR family transcriptional regulator